MEKEIAEHLQKRLQLDQSMLDCFHTFDVMADENDIDGSLSKFFLLLEGRAMPELFDSVKNNPNSTWVTCANDFIKNSTKEEFDSYKVSVIAKAGRYNDEYVRTEIMGSRIAELLGLKCAYVMPLNDKYTSIASVDFLQAKTVKNDKGESECVTEQFESFAEFFGAEGGIGNKYGIDVWINCIERGFKNVDKCKNMDIIDKNKFLEEFIHTFIVRKLILRDNDLNVSNLAITHMGNYENVQLAPNFDLEFSFNESPSILRNNDIPDNEKYIDENMKFLAENFPNITRRVLEKIDFTPEKSKKVFDIIATHQAPRVHMDLFWQSLIEKYVKKVHTSFEHYSEKDSELVSGV